MTRRRSQARQHAESPEVVAQAIGALTEHVQDVWQTLDEIRGELQWVLRNAQDNPGSARPIRITSMALDPCDPEWGKKLNALRPEDLPTEVAQRSRDASVTVDAAQFEHAMDSLSPPRSDGKQSDRITVRAEEFAAAMENVEELVYCCTEPQLAWEGDPDAPSVVCRQCGFVVAEFGSVVDEREIRKSGDEELAPPGPDVRRSSQGWLFGDDE
jgi:hypothetical protein